MSVRSSVLLLLGAWACVAEPIVLSDGDGDGYCSDPALAWVPDRYACEGAAGFGDCDDADPARHPGATEVCNDIDDDCDGALWDREDDADGDGQAPCRGDCDDADPDRNRSASERCNDVDDDCDGAVDEGDDQDRDGWPAWSCEVEPVDCNDFDAEVYPTAPEQCNRRDDNCDGQRDEGVDPPIWYMDGDGDGYGLADSTHVDCEPWSIWTAPSPGDCNDTRDWIHPGAAELCNMVDDDCDGVVDDGWEPLVLRYLDQDGDGFGRASSTSVGCGAAPSFAVASTDCDDTVSTVNPTAPEVCNGRDDDCDTTVDEVGASGCAAFYPDLDRDGFGDPTSSSCQCSASAAFAVSNDGDCDDHAEEVHPNAADVPNLLDDDCDGQADPGAHHLCWAPPSSPEIQSSRLTVRTVDGALAERWTGAAWSASWPVLAGGAGPVCAFVRESSDPLRRVDAEWQRGGEWVPAASVTACALAAFDGALRADGAEVPALLRPETWDPVTGSGASWRCGLRGDAWAELPCKGPACVCSLVGPEVCHDGSVWSVDSCGWLAAVEDDCAELHCVDELVAPHCTDDALGDYGCTAPLDAALRSWLLAEGVPDGLYCGATRCDPSSPGQLATNAVGPVYWLWTETAPSLPPEVARDVLAVGSFTCRRAPDGLDDRRSWDGDCHCAHPTECSADPQHLPPHCAALLPGDCDDDAGGNFPGATEVFDDLFDNDCDGEINEP